MHQPVNKGSRHRSQKGNMRGFFVLLAVCLNGVQTEAKIDKAFIVFSNHLDIGYTENQNGSCAGAVINKYFNEYFPKAINTARVSRSKGKFQYRW